MLAVDSVSFVRYWRAPLATRHFPLRPRKARWNRFCKALPCMAALLVCAAIDSASLAASPRKIDDYRWDRVDRIVAIGDVHGDYAHYLQTLEAARVIDARG